MMQMVLGLGNPGGRYRRTRHNAGFLVVDRLADRWGARCERKQFGALVDRVQISGRDTLLAKPQGFMNRSGQPAASLLGFYKLQVDDVVVVHDDMDLPFGTVRLKQGGGHGGHNGLRDIQACLGGNGFSRVRFGVSRPPPGWEGADYVLSNWTDEEAGTLDALLDRASDAVEAILVDGVSLAMNTFNARVEADAEADADAEPPPEPQGAPPSTPHT